MPIRSARQLGHVAWRRLRWAVRDVFGFRPVVRTVQGVTMTMPWSHRLPDYAGADGPYGQNLVDFAGWIAPADRPLVLLDVGANIGDSTLQIMNRTETRAVCVEADDFYLRFLRTNLAFDDRCAIEAALLVEDDAAIANVTAVRKGGTSRFVVVETAAARDTVTPAKLRARHDVLRHLRLIKSDTDGYDVTLIPALAEAWSDTSPALFFEYDLGLSRLAGNDPLAVWPRLAELGYDQVGVWGNGGDPLWRTDVTAMPAKSTALDAPEQVALKAYWDVAVVHQDDQVGQEAIRALIP